MKPHRLPNSGLVLELRDDVELTPEQEEVLDAYLPIVVAHERARWAALTPRERAAEPKAWRAAAERGVRARG